jgi:hypothetical protein
MYFLGKKPEDQQVKNLQKVFQKIKRYNKGLPVFIFFQKGCLGPRPSLV